MEEKKLWGKTEAGEDMNLYRLENEKGSYATVLDFGAVLYELYVPNKNGELADVVLGFQNPDSYFRNGQGFGATIGPFANRIQGGSFVCDGVTYQLEQNEGQNTLHSGAFPFHRRLWEVTDYDGSSITLKITNSDGQIGFPGNVELFVTYALSNDDTLSISYKATTDKETALNVTNHSYFNLAGHDAGSVLDEVVWIDADEFTVTDEVSVPQGEVGKLAGTPIDFSTPKPLRDGIDDDSADPIRIAHGYDHNYILKTTPGEVKLVATLSDEKAGRKMEVYTDMPGMQLYSGNFIEPCETGKGGVEYKNRTGVAFETQFYPNSINLPQFPQPRVYPGKPWESTTAYKFIAE